MARIRPMSAVFPSVRSWKSRRVTISAPPLRTRFVSDNYFRFLWWLAACYHVLSGLFLLLVGAAQVFIGSPAVCEGMWLIQIDQTLLTVSGYTLVALSIAHFASLTANIRQSISRRQLAFDDEVTNTPGPLKSMLTRLKTHWFVAKSMRGIRVVQTNFGDHGRFGVYGANFDEAFYLCQAIDIVFQTYQANQLTHAIPTSWTHHCVIVMIVCNCAYIPLVDRLLARNEMTRRTRLLLFDVLCDLAIVLVIPICIVFRRAIEFDWTHRLYATSKTYDDAWITNAVAQCRYVLISSYVDFASTVFVHITCFLSVETMKGLVHRARGPVSSSRTHSVVHPIESRVASIDTHAIIHKNTRVLFYIFAVVWGVAIVAYHVFIQVMAAHTVIPTACLQPVQPWFTFKSACSVVIVNCHRLGIAGSNEELTSELSKIEASTVIRLVFSRCPSLAVPKVIASFDRMLYLEIFNSTLVEWNSQAALTQTKTPEFCQLVFALTNFSFEFPTGLLHSELPSKFGMVIYRGNLSELPDEFNGMWSRHTWRYLAVEYSNLVAVPPSFNDIKVSAISLVGNRLKDLASITLDGTYLTNMRVSSNAELTTLPLVVGEAPHLYHIMAEDTAIVAVPLWFETWKNARSKAGKSSIVSFKGSPVCDGVTSSDVCSGVDQNVFRLDLMQMHRPW